MTQGKRPDQIEKSTKAVIVDSGTKIKKGGSGVPLIILLVIVLFFLLLFRGCYKYPNYQMHKATDKNHRK